MVATQPIPESKVRQPKNKRLSQYDRERLVKLAHKLVEDSEDRSALTDAYHLAAAAIRAAVEAQFPPRDMKVLVKYDAARPDQCIYVSRGYGDRDQFCFEKNDAIPLRPSNRGCSYRTFLLEGEAIEALDAFQSRKKEYDASIEQRMADYNALIGASNTFNEVAAVWGEAESLREAIVGSATALTVLNNDVVERIQRDAAQRLAA